MKSDEKMDDRRRFLFKLGRTGAFLALGGAIFGGGCKCGDEDVEWSDEESAGDPPKKKQAKPKKKKAEPVEEAEGA